MEPFYLYVTIGALVLLTIALIVVGVALTKLNSYSAFPPTQSACPDYWDVSSNPNYCGIPLVATPKNRGRIALTGNDGTRSVATGSAINIGMCTTTGKFGCRATPLLLNDGKNTGTWQYVNLGSDNPNWNSKDGLYPGKTKLCAQSAWAKTMDITWDGVSNYNGC